MSKILLRAIIAVVLCVVVTASADAQNTAPTKRPKRLSAKMQLAIERAKVDSLNTLVEELRQRESDWQKAWHDAQAERKKKPLPKQAATALAIGHPIKQAKISISTNVPAAKWKRPIAHLKTILAQFAEEKNPKK